MHALVFAAGRGTRLRPRTDETPKPLLDVAGKPLLERTLRTIVDAGVEAITVVVGYRGDDIVEFVGDTVDGIPVIYARQHEREGLAHAVCRAAEDGYEGDLSSSAAGSVTDFPKAVLTVNGDNVLDCDLSPLVDRHREPGVDGTLLLDRVSRNEAEATALCSLTADGRVQAVESTTGDTEQSSDSGPAYMAAGVQTHDGPALLEACRAVDRGESGEFELTDALESLIAGGDGSKDGARYVGVELDGWHLNVNTPADLETARERFENSS